MGVLPGPNTSSNVPAPKVCMSQGAYAEGVTEQGALCRYQRASPNRQQVFITDFEVLDLEMLSKL